MLAVPIEGVSVSLLASVPSMAAAVSYFQHKTRGSIILYISLLRQEGSILRIIKDNHILCTETKDSTQYQLIAVLPHTPSHTLCPTKATEIVTGQLSI